LKIAIVSHSYLEPENRKNVAALADFTTVRAIVPSQGPVLVFLKYRFQDDQNSPDIFKPLRAFWFSYSGYILCSLDLGFRQFKPDIINVEYNPWSLMFFQSLIYRALFCRHAKIVCTLKKNTFTTRSNFRGWVKEKLARWTLRRTDFVIAGSDLVRHMLAEKFTYPTDRMAVAHHLGVDTKLFSPAEPKPDSDEIIVGFTGRLTEEKGVLDLIEAVKLCRQRGQLPVKLRLLGQGDLSERLAEMAKAEYWLEVLPPVPNALVAGFLTKLDIFVMPSHVVYDHEEHDAHALMEAMSCGVVSIGCRSGIIPELLGDGTGILIKPNDSEALTEAIAGLCRDAETRQKLGALSRSKAEVEFSLKAVAQQRSEIFRKIIDE